MANPMVFVLLIAIFLSLNAGFEVDGKTSIDKVCNGEFENDGSFPLSTW